MMRRRIGGGNSFSPIPSCSSCPSTVDGGSAAAACLAAQGGYRCGSLDLSAVSTQRRFSSLKYVSKINMPEMHQPHWIHDKRFGLYSYERHIAGARRAAMRAKTIFNTNMNLWDSDTDAKTNRFLSPYWNMQREYHLLAGRPHYFETDNPDGRLADAAYEMTTDIRWKGVSHTSFADGHYERGWNKILYRHGRLGSELNVPSSKAAQEILGDELIAIRDAKGPQDCAAWWSRLEYLIERHYDAVGDIGPYTSRNIQHVHRFFVAFHEAMTSHEFQDRYLREHLTATRPAALSDLFGIFLEMEANYVNHDYCPRCSLPLKTTRFCGEGDPDTPFRKHRGRWAPHQSWGTEWENVVCRRAEALWYRAYEDDLFGSPLHTQRQTEALMTVYLKTKQRGKAISFMTNLRGSKEFLRGLVQVTPKLQETFDAILDTTPHPHLLTNGFRQENGSSVYLGEVNKFPLSPQQLRLDMEMQKFRRQQKEEGVIRLPPKDWTIDLSPIPAYQKDPKTGHIVNWRDVKRGIEQSFLSSGLKADAYTKAEWREIFFLTDALAKQSARREELAKQLEVDEASAHGAAAMHASPTNAGAPTTVKKAGAHSTTATSSSSSSRTPQRPYCVFPDSEWYRCFWTGDDMFQPFGTGTLRHGMKVRGACKVFVNPAHVTVTMPKSKVVVDVDVREEVLRQFGVRLGEVLRLTPSAAASTTTSSEGEEKPRAAKRGASSSSSRATNDEVEVMVFGVDIRQAAGSETSLHLLGISTNDPEVIIPLGRDIVELQQQMWSNVVRVGHRVLPDYITAHRTAIDEFEGTIVGVREGQLYVQWGQNVAVSLGTPGQVASTWKLTELPVPSGTPRFTPPTEPFSWSTPFRNDGLEERLEQLKRAPWNREQWVSLIPGKYTPKPKRFGYIQHITQDDFATTEYRHRLQSKQYFNHPNAFEIIPDEHESSVRFGSKNECTRLQGLPSVDRNELENGWSTVSVMSDGEMREVEQCIRDISGKRPGNFVKTPSERSSLKLNETWWTSIEYGWEQHNREQALLEPSERKLVDSGGLPFGGTLPPFGTTYGIGERIRDVSEDFGKGFGLGPHMRSPGDDKSAFNTLGDEDKRVASLGYGSLLVRMFNEKLGSGDIFAFAAEQCHDSAANPKHLLLALHEWRNCGRPPSPLLVRVLDGYLRSEIDAYNANLPDEVPRLSLQRNPAALVPTIDTIWASSDKIAYGLDNASGVVAAAEHLGTIPNVVLRIAMASVQTMDDAFQQHLQDEAVRKFQRDVAAVANLDMDYEMLNRAQSERREDRRPGSRGSSANPTPMVSLTRLDRMLVQYGVHKEEREILLRSLISSGAMQIQSRDGTVFVAVSDVMNAKLELRRQPAQSSGGVGYDGTRGTGSGSNVAGSTLSSHGSGSSEQVLSLNVIIDQLAVVHDGLAMDTAYQIRENLKNERLRAEFCFAAACMVPRTGGVATPPRLPSVGSSGSGAGSGSSATTASQQQQLQQRWPADVQKCFEDHVQGKLVPTAAEAVSMFCELIRRANGDPSIAAKYFTADDEGRFVRIRLPSPEDDDAWTFHFENVRAEVRRTRALTNLDATTASVVMESEELFLSHDSRLSYAVSTATGQPLWVPWTEALPSLTHQVTRILPTTVTLLPSFAAIRNPHQEGAASPLAQCFKGFVLRCFPLLASHRDVIKKYLALSSTKLVEAQNAQQSLRNLLDADRNLELEREFRANTERYWRNVLDGKTTVGDASGATGGSGSLSSTSTSRSAQQHGFRRGQTIVPRVSPSKGDRQGAAAEKAERQRNLTAALEGPSSRTSGSAPTSGKREASTIASPSRSPPSASSAAPGTSSQGRTHQPKDGRGTAGLNRLGSSNTKSTSPPGSSSTASSPSTNKPPN